MTNETIYYKYKKYKYFYNLIGSSEGVNKSGILTRSISSPTIISTSLTAKQYVNYAINRVKICVKIFNPLKYTPLKDKYLIFFDGFENDWSKTRDQIIKQDGINYQCLLITYEYDKCTDRLDVQKGEFLKTLTRIRRIIDLCRFQDVDISHIFRYQINRPVNVSHNSLTTEVLHAMATDKYPSLTEILQYEYPNIFNSDVYRYAVGHSISGAYVLRLWQLGIFDRIYAFSPTITSIPIITSTIDLLNNSKNVKDVHKGIEMNLVNVKVGSEKKDSFVRIPLIHNEIKCAICDICGHSEITNCPHTKIYSDSSSVPVQKKGPRKKRVK